MIKCLVKECNADINGESSVIVGLAVTTQPLMYSVGKTVTVFARA